MSQAIQDKRLTTEMLRLQSLPEEYKVRTEHTAMGTHVHAEFPASMIISPLKDEKIEKYVFEALLDKKFPFIPPQIKCRTEFSEPSFADERDLTASIVGQDWHPALTIAEMLKQVPAFVANTLAATKEGHGYTRMYGTFHLGQPYDVAVLRALPPCSVFECDELTEPEDVTQSELVRRARYVSISANIVLILDREEAEASGTGAPLLTWGTLQSIEKIELGDIPGLVRIHWKTAERRGGNDESHFEEPEEEEKSGEWV